MDRGRVRLWAIVGAALLLAACGDDGGADRADAQVADGAEAPDAGEPDAGEPGEPDAGEPDAAAAFCNGSAALCARRYDDVAFATTHNAMSAAAEGWTHTDQRFGIARQLADGIRGLMLDVHTFEGQPTLCHGSSCASGHRPLVDGLRDIATFLADHPRDVVTIIFEPYVAPAQIRDALIAVGLDTRLHTQAAGAPWPTLGELIAADHRLVVFTERDGGAYDWFHDVWQHAWDTNWEFYTPEEMNCRINRGRADSPLFIFNNFMVTADEAEAFARRLNVTAFLLHRARLCEASSGQRVNFVTVDYYDVGDVLSVVDALNQGR